MTLKLVVLTLVCIPTEDGWEQAKQEIYWLVDDIDSIFDSISQKAEICLPLQKVSFGKLFGVRNPDGQPCYILELSKDRPSQEV